jgi:hypothetical protein
VAQAPEGLSAPRRRPRRRFRSPEDALGDHLVHLDELSDDDLELVTRFIDALATKTRLKTLAGNAS